MNLNVGFQEKNIPNGYHKRCDWLTENGIYEKLNCFEEFEIYYVDVNECNSFYYFPINGDARNFSLLSEENFFGNFISDKVLNDLVKNKIDLIGKKLKKSINSNRPIYHSNLEKDWLIQKNSSIIIENKIGGITVKDQGIALENADFMDVLKVKNIKSGKIIYGFAKNQKKVVLKAKQN